MRERMRCNRRMRYAKANVTHQGECNAPGRMIIRPYWNAFSLKPSPLMARRDM